MNGIITLCGSHRFKTLFEEIAQELGIDGWVVLRPAFAKDAHLYSISDGRYATAKQKLDFIHKEKIAMSQGIVIINKNRYIGDSTKSEIYHAVRLGKILYAYQSDGLSIRDLRADMSSYGMNSYPAIYNWRLLLDA